MKPLLGTRVNYTTATGNVCAAVVICTEDTYNPGRWENVMDRDEYLDRVANPTAAAPYEGPLDNDGDRWVPSQVPPVKPGRVHLQVTAPNGRTFVEYNVGPGTAGELDAPSERGTCILVEEPYVKVVDPDAEEETLDFENKTPDEIRAEYESLRADAYKIKDDDERAMALALCDLIGKVVEKL